MGYARGVVCYRRGLQVREYHVCFFRCLCPGCSLRLSIAGRWGTGVRYDAVMPSYYVSLNAYQYRLDDGDIMGGVRVGGALKQSERRLEKHSLSTRTSALAG